MLFNGDENGLKTHSDLQSQQTFARRARARPNFSLSLT
jgi:hypothetical protein